MKLSTYLSSVGRGSTVALAKALECPASLVSAWASGARPIPAERCPDIERLTGVRCEELRPDVNWTVLRGAPAEEVVHG